MFDKLKKAYISIEIVIIAAVVLIGGLAGTSAFLKNGQSAQKSSAEAMNNTIDMIAGGDMFPGGLFGGLPEAAGPTKYYNSLSLAMEDINAGTFGENANAESSGNILAYLSTSGEMVLSLQSDLTETTGAIIETDTKLFLNGRKITTTGASAITVNTGNLEINGAQGSSEILVKNSAANSVIVQNGGQTTINGGKYSVEAGEKASVIKTLSGSVTANNITITATGTNTMYGVAIQNGSYFTANNLTVDVEGSGTTYGVYGAGKFDIYNSTINANSTAAKTRALYLTSTGDGTISNSKTIGTCDLYPATIVSSSQGINNAGKLTVNNCYVWGSHSGLTNSGELIVNGGTYESPGHGGMYFGNLIKPAYIRDAVLRHTAVPENATSSIDNNKGGFYIGGGSDRNGVVVYMDNCEIYGEIHAFTLRGTSGEHDNTLYISNSRLTSTGYVRIDNNTHKLYLGVGNNFDGSDAATSTHEPMTSQVIHTNETYR